ncbi:MAG: hypothetical protein B6D62_01495 [Candidatus Cloacimonas sp. 4484_275]|nr:MAG: hypothetical protein B6D62_01495 [Candidatus Cloacimonas sp. 4484_275]
MQGLPSIPYLIGLENLGDGHNVNVRWYSLADETYVCYKLSDAPASDWEYIEVDNDLSEYVVSGLISNTSYKFKIAVQYDDVYLESQTQEITTYTMSAEEEQIADNISFGCFPNPFNPAKSKANIFFTVKTNSFINVEIYNLKGQKVKTLAKDKFSVGSHIINWDGKDENGKPVNSGIYLFNLQTTDRKTVFGKLVLIK